MHYNYGAADDVGAALHSCFKKLGVRNSGSGYLWRKALGSAEQTKIISNTTFIMKNLLFIAACMVAFSACNNSKSSDASTEAPSGDTTTVKQETEAGGDKNLCYLRAEGKDTTIVNIKLNADGTVSGTYDWLPWEKDSARGTLKGRKQGDMLTLLFDYTMEGSNQQEEKLMRLTGDLLAEAEGELVEGDGGVFKIKEGATLKWLPLSKVDCK